jgi:BirA family biotin operon repressor/biotin-[acetyl-CoA-carboxylase] ligase
VIFNNSKIIRLSSTGSTNQYMSELLSGGSLDEGTVVVTDAQTKGKGQENNIWESEPGKNLTATIVLYPTFLNPEFQFHLTRIISLSVCQLLDSLDLPVKSMIKWPNDIYLDNRKVAGILIKNDITGGSVSTTIAGLGLNINQKEFSTAAQGAVSLTMLTGKQYDLESILTDWHKCVAHWYEKLRTGDLGLIEITYLSRMYLLNQPAGFIVRGVQMNATIKGIAEYGMLLLEGNDGRQYKCSLKEVIFIGTKTRAE